MNRSPRLTALVLCLCLQMKLGHCQIREIPASTQTIPLDAGWNLITFQVLPEDANGEQVFGTLGEAFVAAWTYDNAAKSWSRYARPIAGESGHSQVASMPALQFGRAYWVYMDSPVPEWRVPGCAPPLAPPVQFVPGWNLVGLPLGPGKLTEPVSMLSVLAASGMDYDVILRWEAGQYNQFTADDTDFDQFSVFDAHKGYWVRVKGAGHTLQPILVSAVRADADIDPLGNYPSHEDLVVSDSPVPLGASNQTHIVFFEGEDSHQLTVANNGGGILLWSVSWEPYDAPATPWLTLSRSQGVATIENDIVLLNLNRKDLVKGTYRGVLRLATNAGSRSFEVVAHVPGLGGEWRGSATIASANGLKNHLPDIDLHLDFFEDASMRGVLRGLMDSRNALLWPVDVPLIGHSLADDRSVISLSGGYVLPPGDQNNPPYEAFQGELEDVDWNCNGRVDAVNPYPFPIYRSVSLMGVLTQASPTEGYTLEGSYTEVIFGMLRQPIRLEGTFKLTRESARPFVNRRPIPGEERLDGTQPVVLKTYRPATPRIISPGSVAIPLNFVTEMVLESVSVGVDLGDATGASVKISLVSPDGTAVVLHDQTAKASMRSLQFPEARVPKESFQGLYQAGVSTRGDWKLVVENYGANAALLHEWSLQLQGQPVFEFTGRVVDAATGGALSADVSLDGFPASEVRGTHPDGSVTFSRLPGIPINLSAQRPGYEAPDPAMPGLDPMLRTPSFPETCNPNSKQALAAKFRPLPVLPFPASGTDGFGDVGSAEHPVVLKLRTSPDLGDQPRLLAVPASGPVPLTVEFTIASNVGGGEAAGQLMVWDFGDGTVTNGIGLVKVNHTYWSAPPAGFPATVRIGSITFAATRVVPMPSPGHSPYPLNFFQIHLSGGGTIPANYLDALTGSNDVTQPAPMAELVMVQHADCASVDIDRFPFTTAGQRNFHLDGFTNGMYRPHPADYAGNFRAEDSNYKVTLLDWELAGECGCALEDEEYHVHPKPGFLGDCTLPRYRMVCNVGPLIVPPGNTEIQAPLSAGLPPPFPDPLLAKAQVMAQARGLRMVTGPLATFWRFNDGQ